MASTSLTRRRKTKRSRTAVGYCRVSTEGQADNGDSLVDQRERIKAYAKANGLALVEIIEDPGHSGSNLNRPGARRLLQMIEDREVDAVVFAKLDRLTRSLRDLTALLDLFEDSGVKFCSVTESIDTSTAAGKVHAHIMGVMAEWFRNVIAERTREVLDSKRQRGERIGRFAPFGFRYNDQGRRVIDRREQKVIGLARELRAKGESLRDIGVKLARQGYLNRNRRPFNPNSIKRMTDDQ